MKETMLTGESKDIRNENIEILKDLFPEIISEDKIDFEMFKTIFSDEIIDSDERYSFRWPGKIYAIKESQKQSTGTLRPYKDESKNWENTKNLYIEGDNLEVLKLLQKTYYEKVKAIYIDPPYNTGKDFVYSDNFRDNLQNYLELTGQVSSSKDGIRIKLTTNTESDGRYHSNWLNMMYPRLKLARNLLKNDGAIFISIDDNEMVNLKKICDEIFGEENFICNFIWKSKTGGAGDSSNITVDTEYILCYAKNIKEVNLNKNVAKRDFKFKDKYYSERGLFNIRNLDESGIRYSETLDFIISKKSNKIFVNDESIEINEDFFFEEVFDDFSIVPGGKNNHLKKYTWRWSKPKIINGLEKGYLCFKKNNSGDIKLVQKTYEFFNTSEERKVEEHLIPYRNFIDFTNTSEGTKDLKEVFENKKFFDYPKPVTLINHILKISSDDDDIILDFFSGSATTAHACFRYNSSENKNVKFILIQIAEATEKNSSAHNEGLNNICEIAKERIRRSGDLIVKETNKYDLDIGFKVFKLDSSNIKKWESNYENLIQTLLVAEDNFKEGRTHDDLIYEIMLKYGIDLTLPVEKYENKNIIYSIGASALLICLDDKITKDITDDIIELSKDAEKCRVVFKDNGFISDSDKTNIKQILKVNGIDEFITI